MKKRILEQLNNFCGVDVGCTNVKMVGIVDGCAIQKSVPSGDNMTRRQLVDAITAFYKDCDCNFRGIGIAFSGMTRNGYRIKRTKLKCLENLSVADFTHLYCDDVRLINDSNATALAGTLEYPEAQVLLGVTNGTGIGAGVTINGKLFTGGRGLAGEIYGNPVIMPNGEITKCGRIASGSKVLKKIGLDSETSEVQKDEITKEAATHLGMQVVSLIHAYNPDVVYLSGGGFELPNYMKYFQETVDEWTYEHFKKDLLVVRSNFSSYAGCYGAMKYVHY